MKLNAYPAIAAFYLFVPGTSFGQSAEAMFQSAINAKGKSCEAVTTMNPVAMSSDGSTIVGVACSGGETYAMKITTSKNIEYISTCSTFASVTNESCF